MIMRNVRERESEAEAEDYKWQCTGKPSFETGGEGSDTDADKPWHNGVPIAILIELQCVSKSMPCQKKKIAGLETNRIKRFRAILTTFC